MFDCFQALGKLCGFFDAECEQTIERLFDRTVEFDRGTHLLWQGEKAESVYLLCSGWAARYILAEQGRRQIVELLLPGDIIPDPSGRHGLMEDSVVALNHCTTAACSPAALEDAMMAQPNLARTFAWRGRRDKAILRAWIANIGQRNAIARTAHLISELSVRLAQAGMVHNGRFEIPLTQEDLGDTLGITSVHMNRTLMELRARGLLDLRSKRAYLHDEAGIKRTGNFDGAYLSPA